MTHASFDRGGGLAACCPASCAVDSSEDDVSECMRGAGGGVPRGGGAITRLSRRNHKTDGAIASGGRWVVHGELMGEKRSGRCYEANKRREIKKQDELSQTMRPSGAPQWSAKVESAAVAMATASAAREPRAHAPHHLTHREQRAAGP